MLSSAADDIGVRSRLFCSKLTTIRYDGDSSAAGGRFVPGGVGGGDSGGDVGGGSGIGGCGGGLRFRLRRGMVCRPCCGSQQQPWRFRLRRGARDGFGRKTARSERAGRI